MLAANQLFVQVDLAAGRPDAILLTFGHASAPAVTGSPEQQDARLRQVQEVPVQSVVRLNLTAQRLREWVELLQQTLAKIDNWPTGEDR